MEVYNEVKHWKDRKSQLFDLLGIEQSLNFKRDKILNFVFEYLKESAIQSSYNKTKSKLYLEFCNAFKNNWFIIFDTLTVKADHYEDVFKQGANHWRDFIRTIDRQVASATYGSYRKAKNKNYFKYFAVIEEGSTTDRLHIHVIYFMKKLPKGCVDPNAGLAIAYRQEIDYLKQFWSYGSSTPKPVRFSENDPFGKLDWRWIVEYNQQTQSFQPKKASTIGAMCGYLIKYVMKSKQLKLKGELYSWKIRMSRDLGKDQIKKTLQLLPDKQLLVMIIPRQYPIQILMYGEKISSKLIRDLAVKIWLRRYPNTEVMPKSIHLQKLLRSTTKTKNAHNSQSFGSILLDLIKDEGIFNITRYVGVWKKIGLEYPPFTIRTTVGAGNMNDEI
jgi:hypothetical protein